MFEMNRDNRDNWLIQLFYSRMASLGSLLNSRINGGPFPTLIRAFVGILSDAVEECISLFSMYSPNTTSGVAAAQVLGFFERPQLLAVETEQVFTVIRPVATGPFLLPAGASIQTGMLQSGKAYSFSIQAADATTLADGVYYAKVVFKSAEKGLATAVTTPQVMQQISGFPGPCYVLAGSWDDSAVNPLVDIGTSTIDEWLAAHLSHFGISYRVQGRDDEDVDTWRARCFARWDEQSTGATAGAYESWARSYLDPVTGNAPVALARVTKNQVFHAASCSAPVDQPLIDGQEYVMGVEVAIALAAGAIPAPADRLAVANALFPLKAQTDKVWVRGPNPVPAGPGTCTILLRAPTSFQAQVHEVAASFFVYSATYPDNYQGLGSTIYQSELIQALKNLSSLIEDVKVTFTLSGKVVDGDIVLDAYDQIQMADLTTAITVTVL